MPLVIIPQIQCKLAERPTGALAAWRGSSPDLGESEEGGSLEFIQRAAPQRREKYRQLRRPPAWSVIAGRGNRNYVSHWGLYNIDGSYWSFPNFRQVTLQTRNHQPHQPVSLRGPAGKAARGFNQGLQTQMALGASHMI